MYSMIILNILLSGMMLEVNIGCMNDIKQNGKYNMQCTLDHQDSKFGFSTLA